MPRQDRCLRGKTGAFSEAALNSPGTALTLTRRAGNICRIWGRKEGSNALIVAHLTCRRAPDLGGCTSAVERSERCFGRSIESWHSRHQSDDRFAASSHSKSAPVVPTTGSVPSPLAPNTGVGGLPLTSTSSGAPAAAAATSTSGAIAPPSGTASLGAMGRDMPECMAAWDNRTHITKSRWKEICKRSLADLDL